ncbi:MAG: ATP-binding cassette domain-containing protein [Desulfofustis sp.]
MTEKTIVRVSEVTKNFDLGKIVVEVLKGIDLEIEEGKYLSIMGPSGSGKSTLFKMIGGLDKPTSGKVVRRPAAARRRRPGTGQQPGHRFSRRTYRKPRPENR